MKYCERIYSEAEIKLIKEIFDMYINQLYDDNLEELVLQCKEMFLEHQKTLKEIKRLNNIIKRFEEDLREVYLTFGEFSEEYTEKKIRELKGEDKE